MFFNQFNLFWPFKFTGKGRNISFETLLTPVNELCIDGNQSFPSYCFIAIQEIQQKV